MTSCMSYGLFGLSGTMSRSASSRRSRGPVAEHRLAVEPGLRRPAGDEAVELHEVSLVEQNVETLARRQLPLLVLRLEAPLAASELGLGASTFEEIEFLADA